MTGFTLVKDTSNEYSKSAQVSGQVFPNLKPYTLTLKTLNPKPQTPDPRPQTPDPNPQSSNTINPTPHTPNPSSSPYLLLSSLELSDTK